MGLHPKRARGICGIMGCALRFSPIIAEKEPRGCQLAKTAAAFKRDEVVEITRKVDARGRVVLPEEFANTHITIKKAEDGTYILQTLGSFPSQLRGSSRTPRRRRL